MPTLVLCLSMTALVYGQDIAIEIQGTVKDNNGIPLSGASIVLIGSSNGAATNFEGQYVLRINRSISDDDFLEASSLGFKKERIRIGGEDTINFVLEPDNEINEVIVTAQGITSEKRSIGYGISVLTAEEIKDRPYSDLAQALNGKISGLRVYSDSGRSGEEAFKNKVDSLRESMMVAIEMAEENVTENVKEAVTCDIDAWYVFVLDFYKSGNRMMGKYIAGGRIDMVLRKHTLLVDDIRIKDYKVSEFYRRSASSSLGKNARKHAKLYDIDKRVAFNKVVKNEIENEELRNAMSFSNTKRYMVKVDEDVREDLKNSFLEVSTNEDHIMEVHAIFEDMSGLVEGNPSPAFINYEDANGDTVSLSDLRGKYVYIDFWATWCAPCKKEFPYLKELEEKYKDHDIEFVGISLDKPESKEKWRKMVAEKELSGIQLFAGKAFDSDFAKAYHVSAIPKFIILDKEGKIVTANAPRPSDEKGIDKIFKTLDL